MIESLSLADLVSTVPARAIYVAKHFGEGALMSVTFGFCGGLIGATFFPMTLGPLVPFITLSCGGFCLGAYSCWRKEVNRAEVLLSRYPSIINHRLRVDFPGLSPDSFVLRPENFGSRSLAETTWLVLACQSAASCINQVEELRAQSLVDQAAAAAHDKDEVPDS